MSKTARNASEWRRREVTPNAFIILHPKRKNLERERVPKGDECGAGDGDGGSREVV